MERGHFAAYHCNQRRGIGGGANRHIRERIRELPVRHVDVPARVFQIEQARIAGDSDYRAPSLTAELDALADGVNSRSEGAARHRFADDYRLRRVAAVLLGKLTTGFERNPDGSQVARRDGYAIQNRIPHYLVRRLSVGRVSHIPPDRGFERAHQGGAGRDHSGLSLNAFEQLPKVISGLLDLWVFPPVQLKPKSEDIALIESGIDLSQIEETARDETSADEQRQRNGDLRDYQRAAQSLPAPFTPDIAAGGVERFAEADPRYIGYIG